MVHPNHFTDSTLHRGFTTHPTQGLSDSTVVLASCSGEESLSLLDLLMVLSRLLLLLAERLGLS